jgi:uncharacterized protein
MIELNLVGVRLELTSQQPIVLLKELEGERVLPIWIGLTEAKAIAEAMQGQVPPRPMTHDLFRNVLQEIGVGMDRVVITELRDGTFYALIHMSQNGSRFEISSRPSDAIALAVRASVPIFANEEVLTEASILIPSEEDEDQEVERFKEFLDQVSPEDFA